MREARSRGVAQSMGSSVTAADCCPAGPLPLRWQGRRAAHEEAAATPVAAAVLHAVAGIRSRRGRDVCGSSLARPVQGPAGAGRPVPAPPRAAPSATVMEARLDHRGVTYHLHLHVSNTGGRRAQHATSRVKPSQAGLAATECRRRRRRRGPAPNAAARHSPSRLCRSKSATWLPGSRGALVQRVFGTPCRASLPQIACRCQM